MSMFEEEGVKALLKDYLTEAKGIDEMDKNSIEDFGHRFFDLVYIKRICNGLWKQLYDCGHAFEFEFESETYVFNVEKHCSEQSNSSPYIKLTIKNAAKKEIANFTREQILIPNGGVDYGLA